MRGVHAPGFDINFSPEKEVSISAMLDPDPAVRQGIIDAHNAAVKYALSYFESYGNPTRTSKGKQHFAPTELLAYLTTHRTARPSAVTEASGRPPDPQLHSHVFVFNVAFSKKWRAIDHRWHVHLNKEMQAMYDTALAWGLREMNLKTDVVQDRRNRTRVRLLGASQELVHELSTRSREVKSSIRDFKKKYGRNPEECETHDLVSDGRRPKGYCPHREDYVPHLEKLGLGFEKALRGRSALKPNVRSEAFRKILSSKGFHRDGATLNRQQIRHIVLDACVGLMSPEDAEKFLLAFMKSTELVMTKAGEKWTEKDEFTTQTLLDLSQRTIKRCLDKTTELHAAPDESVARAALRKSRVPLTEEQVEAYHAFISESGFEMLEGSAGCGKTTLLRSVVEAYRFRGTCDQVLSVSTAANTAERTGLKIDADECLSIESLCARVKSGSLTITNKTLLFLDESVMCDEFRFGMLMEYAGDAIFRVLGDPKQLQAIGPGGTHVEVASRVKVHRLTQVFRQKFDWYLEACKLVREERAWEALEIVERQNGLHIGDLHVDAVDLLLAQHNEYRDAGYRISDIIVCTDQPNDVIDDLNARIQEDRLARGELKGEPLEFHCRRTARSEKLYVGDEIAFTTGIYDANRKYIRNDKRGQITWIDHDTAEVEMSVDGRKIRIPLDRFAEEQPIRLAYAGHVTRVQGDEAKFCLILPGDLTTGESGYMQLSRGELQPHVFLSRQLFGDQPKHTLGSMWNKYCTKHVAQDPREPLDWTPPTRVMERVEPHLEGWKMSQEAQKKFRHFGRRRSMSHEMSR